MEDIKHNSFGTSYNFRKEGLIVIKTTDQAIRLKSWVKQVPPILLGFYYGSTVSLVDSVLKISIFSLVPGPNCLPKTLNINKLRSHPVIQSLEIFPLYDDDFSIEFRKLIFWLESADNKFDKTWEPLKTLTSLKSLLDRDPAIITVLRSIYESRYKLFPSSFNLPTTVTKLAGTRSDKFSKISALQVRDTIIKLAEVAYEAAISGNLEKCLDELLLTESTSASDNLLFKIDSWLDRGLFYQDIFKHDFNKIHSVGSKTDQPVPRIISLCDSDMVNLPEIRDELKTLIISLTDLNQPPVIDFRKLIRIYNQVSVLINKDLLELDSSGGTSWPALVVDSSKQLVNLQPIENLKLTTCDQLTISLCRPEIVDLSKEEAMEVLIYIEGLTDFEQTKYLNIKNALVEMLKQQ